MKRLNLFFVLIFCLLVAGLMLMRAKPPQLPAESNTETVAPPEEGPQRKTSSISKNSMTEDSSSIPGSSSNESPEKINTETKIAVLDEILRSRNDNDPRLDSMFRNMNNDDKRAFEKKYSEHKKEQLNERGTIVYLLGRNISDANDLSFLKVVSEEKPCSTLANCNEAYHSDVGDHSAANDITLAYPQIMALKSLQRFISGTQDQNLKHMAYEILSEASKSNHEKVKDFALGILASLEN